MFIAHNRVRMHDVDLAGILYFPRQFRFAHDAFEDFLASDGITFNQIFKQEDFVFVVVHAEADYLAPLHVGDVLEVSVVIKAVGTTSFIVLYEIRKNKKDLVGTAQTVHVTLDSKTRKKIPIPKDFREFLENNSTE